MNRCDDCIHTEKHCPRTMDVASILKAGSVIYLKGEYRNCLLYERKWWKFWRAK